MWGGGAGGRGAGSCPTIPWGGGGAEGSKGHPAVGGSEGLLPRCPLMRPRHPTAVVPLRHWPSTSARQSLSSEGTPGCPLEPLFRCARNVTWQWRATATASPAPMHRHPRTPASTLQSPIIPQTRALESGEGTPPPSRAPSLCPATVP